MNSHVPFDACQPWGSSCGSNCSNDPLVDKLIGNAYHVVRTVYCNLGNLKLIYDFLNQYGMVLGVQSEDELKAMTTSASYVRLYGFDNTNKRIVKDYLYVEGDRTGVLPNDPTATGSWILVDTSNSGGSGGDDGKASPPYIPYTYNNGSAIGGETTIPVPTGTVGVPMIVVEGYTNLVGYGFTYDAASLTVTLTQPLEPGDEVHLFLTGTPAVPDNPNVTDWVQINWLYNGGYASGGEQVIAIPYTFESVPAIYKNGDRYYAGLADKSYTVDTANQRILLTEPLATNDRLIITIGGESTTLIMSDRTIQEVARSANVKDTQVILSTNTTQYLNDMKVVYDVVAQKIYGLPSLPTNVYINNVSNGHLTYSPGNITVDLLPLVPEVLTTTEGASHVNSESGFSVQDYLYPVPKDYYIGSFFNSNADPTAVIVSSTDGFKFSKLNYNKLVTTNGAPAGSRDPSITYLNGKWYLAHTSVGAGASGTGVDCTIMVSDDMLTWTPTGVNCGPVSLKTLPGSVLGGTAPTITTIWAPELYVENGELYLLATCNANGTTTDEDGTTVNFMLPFICKCTDINALTFDEPTAMFTNNSVTHIDVSLAKKDGTYYVAIKNEYSKEIEIWTSTTLRSGYTYLSTATFDGIAVEGPSLVWSNARQTWRLYADAFRLQGIGYYIETSSLTSWGSPTRVDANFDIRHGTVINLANLEDSVSAIESFKTAAALSHYAPNVALGTNVGITADTTVVPENNAVYRVSGSTVATLTVNAQGGDVFYAIVSSGVASANLIVTGSKVDGTHNLGLGRGNLTLFKFMYNQTTGFYNITSPTTEKLLSTSNTWSAWQNFAGTGATVAQYLDLGSSNTTSGSRRVGFYTAGNSTLNGEVTMNTANLLRMATVTGANAVELYASGSIALSAGANNIISTKGNVTPSVTNTYALGSSSLTWANIYSQVAVTVVSDENHKSFIQDIPDELLDAWATVEFQMWKLNSAIELKGKEEARWHVGIIAQRLKDALENSGLDWTQYGIITYESWEAQEEITESWEATYDEEGNLLQEAGTHVIQPAREAGEVYMVRLEECLVLEAALMRRTSMRLEERLAALEAK